MHIKVKSIPSKVFNCYKREIELAGLIKHLLKKDKLLDYVGLPGVGKSLLARNAIHYLSERKYFSDGIMTVQLSSVNSVSLLQNLLWENF